MVHGRVWYGYRRMVWQRMEKYEMVWHMVRYDMVETSSYRRMVRS